MGITKMRLLFCINRDIYANIALNALLPELMGDTCRVFFSDGVGRKSQPTSPLLEFLKFYEQDLPNRYLFPLYEALPSPVPGPLKTFQQLAETYDVPMENVRNLRAAETIESVRQFAPDLILSIRFGHIFKGEIIEIPRYGLVNMHSGLLPEYRGILATFWSLLHGETEYGYTLHHISDATIDTGAIIERHALSVDPNQSLFEHIVRLYPHAAENLLQIIQQYRHGQTPKTLPQPRQAGAYYSLPTTEDFEAFHHKGLRLLDEAVYYQWLKQYYPLLSPHALPFLDTDHLNFETV
jgi:methionyl-tRNA formyltransferase